MCCLQEEPYGESVEIVQSQMLGVRLPWALPLMSPSLAVVVREMCPDRRRHRWRTHLFFEFSECLRMAVKTRASCSSIRLLPISSTVVRKIYPGWKSSHSRGVEHPGSSTRTSPRSALKPSLGSRTPVKAERSRISCVRRWSFSSRILPCLRDSFLAPLLWSGSRGSTTSRHGPTTLSSAECIGFIEVKAPGEGAAPHRFRDPHDRAQRATALRPSLAMILSCRRHARGQSYSSRLINRWMCSLRRCDISPLGLNFMNVIVFSARTSEWLPLLPA